ncbi:uncharacterized protein TNCT_251101 [Trichonephila clavata]|uniref:Uncharacterized protein n=1 Tax=Trichonephila clavata TaxID=2740835 RepID=A0A8X6FFH7_TRICU|nr:uncharacterized protein TNCT_251101 [Trichonephila clavata]
MNATERIKNGVSISAAGAVEIIQVDDEIASILTLDCVGLDCVQSSFMKTHSEAASARFTAKFVFNPFGHKCDLCDRLWFLRSWNPAKEKHLPLLNNTFSEELVTDYV